MHTVDAVHECLPDRAFLYQLRQRLAKFLVASVNLSRRQERKSREGPEQNASLWNAVDWKQELFLHLHPRVLAKVEKAVLDECLDKLLLHRAKHARLEVCKGLFSNACLN